MLKRFICIIAVIACFALNVGVARASSGYVSGTVRFTQMQGNYCPTGRDCTGARYLESAFEQPAALRNIQVLIVDASDTSTVWGQGVSSSSGYFNIAWNNGSAGTLAAKIQIKYRHQDTRFEIRSFTSNGIYFGTTATFTLANGTTSGSPQASGTYTWGSAASPSYLSNLYDGARRMWTDSLTSSGLMGSKFTNIQIKAWSCADGKDSPGCECATSCASGSTVKIGTATMALLPQSRIMHELGHIVSSLASERAGGFTDASYNYPLTAPGPVSWWATLPEWKAVSFEEGLASYYADTALYTPDAVVPATCVGAGSCWEWLEDSKSSTFGCPGDEDRWPRSVEKYLWDVYDSAEDSNYADTVEVVFWKTINTLYHYDPGTGDHQKDEIWNSSFSAVDNFDGQSAYDFRWNLQNSYGFDTSALYQHNCWPGG